MTDRHYKKILFNLKISDEYFRIIYYSDYCLQILKGDEKWECIHSVECYDNEDSINNNIEKLFLIILKNYQELFKYNGNNSIHIDTSVEHFHIWNSCINRFVF